VKDYDPPVGPDSFRNLVRQANSGATSIQCIPTKVEIALIDSLRFSRDCLIRAFGAIHPELSLVPFSTVADCVRSAPAKYEVILYYSRHGSSFENAALQQIKTLREAFLNIPIIVLSDAQSALQPRHIRNALNSGAQGFIPTLVTDVPATLAAIRFVKDGGTFAPLDLLLPGPSERSATAGPPPPDRLTPRQLTVLSRLRQGKANKVIAYELGMTESTVKVHIRNIMRKMGATNRTQAVYNSQHLDDYPDNCGLNE
jgi:DNA-binding NarL/FixJ family response regulator